MEGFSNTQDGWKCNKCNKIYLNADEAEDCCIELGEPDELPVYNQAMNQIADLTRQLAEAREEIKYLKEDIQKENDVLSIRAMHRLKELLGLECDRIVKAYQIEFDDLETAWEEIARLNAHAVDVYKEQRKAYLIQQAEIARLRANLESIKRAASQTGRIAIANMAIAALEASDES